MAVVHAASEYMAIGPGKGAGACALAAHKMAAKAVAERRARMLFKCGAGEEKFCFLLPRTISESWQAQTGPLPGRFRPT